jgi:hypothetical protein
MPAAVVAVLFLLAITRLPSPIKCVMETVTSPLKNFLTLAEAETLLAQADKVAVHHDVQHAPLWPMIVLSLTALLETLIWTAVGTYRIWLESFDPWKAVPPYLMALSWLYACCKPILKPSTTPPYDLLVLYLTRIIFDVIVVGGVLYDKQVKNLPLLAPTMMTALILNLIADLVSVLTVFSMPLRIPSAYVDPKQIVSIYIRILPCLSDFPYRESLSLQKTIRLSGDGSASIGCSR